MGTPHAGERVKKTTISLYLRTLRVLVGYARKEGVVKHTFNPFDEFRLTKYQRIQTPKRSITVEDIQKLAAVKTLPGSEEFHAQQLFLFTYYCRGINFTDVSRLTRESVYSVPGGFRLRYCRQKTNHPFDMLLLEPALKIWNYYLGCQSPTNNYVWPVLDSEVHRDPQQIDWRMHRMNRNWNRALRRVGELAGISQYLTLYVARHSFATSMKNAGASVAVISEMMGHDSEETTRIYLRQFPQSTLDNAAQLLVPNQKPPIDK